MISIQEGVSFIRQHGMLKLWTDGEIEREIDRAIKSNALVFSVSKEEQLNGICFGRWDSSEQFHVYCAIGNIKPFLRFLKLRFPKCKTLTAFRNNKFVTYKVSKFYGR